MARRWKGAGGGRAKTPPPGSPQATEKAQAPAGRPWKAGAPRKAGAPGKAPEEAVSPEEVAAPVSRVGELTPGADIASVPEHEPELRTIPLEGRIAGVAPDADVSRDIAPMSTRNISGARGVEAPPDPLYGGPDRRRRQEEPERWFREDRRLRPFTYGSRRTL